MQPVVMPSVTPSVIVERGAAAARATLSEFCARATAPAVCPGVAVDVAEADPAFARCFAVPAGVAVLGLRVAPGADGLPVQGDQDLALHFSTCGVAVILELDARWWARPRPWVPLLRLCGFAGLGLAWVPPAPSSALWGRWVGACADVLPQWLCETQFSGFACPHQTVLCDVAAEVLELADPITLGPTRPLPHFHPYFAAVYREVPARRFAELHRRSRRSLVRALGGVEVLRDQLRVAASVALL